MRPHRRLQFRGSNRRLAPASLLHVRDSFASQANDFEKGEKGEADINERIIECCLASLSEGMSEPARELLLGLKTVAAE